MLVCQHHEAGNRAFYHSMLAIAIDVVVQSKPAKQSCNQCC